MASEAKKVVFHCNIEHLDCRCMRTLGHDGQPHLCTCGAEWLVDENGSTTGVAIGAHTLRRALA